MALSFSPIRFVVLWMLFNRLHPHPFIIIHEYGYIVNLRSLLL